MSEHVYGHVYGHLAACGDCGHYYDDTLGDHQCPSTVVHEIADDNQEGP